jgi:hypothetical protein
MMANSFGDKNIMRILPDKATLDPDKEIDSIK